MGKDYVQLISILPMKHGEQAHDYSCFAFSCFLQWLDFLYGDKYMYGIYDFAIEGMHLRPSS